MGNIGSAIDVGTGAGFPGLPVAITMPALAVELLDSNARKIGFVQHVIGELEISNATAVRSRAENYAPGRGFDTVIARALASIPRLIELAGHLAVELDAVPDDQRAGVGSHLRVDLLLAQIDRVQPTS